MKYAVKIYESKGLIVFSSMTALFVHSHVSGSNLLVCSSFIYNHFYDCEDTNYYLSGEEITDVISLPAERVSQVLRLLSTIFIYCLGPFADDLMYLNSRMFYPLNLSIFIFLSASEACMQYAYDMFMHLPRNSQF